MKLEDYKNNLIYPNKKDYQKYRISIVNKFIIEYNAVYTLKNCNDFYDDILQWINSKVDHLITYVEITECAIEYLIQNSHSPYRKKNSLRSKSTGKEWTQHDLHVNIEKLDAINEEYFTLRQQYNKEDSRLLNKFKKDLIASRNLTNHPKADLLYSKSWDIGHSSGLAEIMIIFDNLLELII